jgi:hypothetical protein
MITGVNADFESRNSFLLIAYQFGDVLIPCILFAAASGGGAKRFAGVTGLFFFIYALLVGFRYKLALVFVPLVFWHIFRGERLGRATKFVTTVLLGLGGVGVFSAMTLFRVKFGTPDFSREVRSGDIMYSFFAESNILFGLTVILTGFVDRGIFFYLTPIFDSIKELIPHLLWPNRTSGLYLEDMVSEVGRNAYLGYPFIGEFALMGGYFGIAIGDVVYVLVYRYFRGSILKNAPNEGTAVMGAALLAIIMGYYHYSRGYLPQATKAYIFVLVPYLVLCFFAKRRAVRCYELNAGLPGSGQCSLPQAPSILNSTPTSG